MQMSNLALLVCIDAGIHDLPISGSCHTSMQDIKGMFLGCQSEWDSSRGHPFHNNRHVVLLPWCHSAPDISEFWRNSSLCSSNCAQAFHAGLLQGHAINSSSFQRVLLPS